MKGSYTHGEISGEPGSAFWAVAEGAVSLVVLKHGAFALGLKLVYCNECVGVEISLLFHLSAM